MIEEIIKTIIKEKIEVKCHICGKKFPVDDLKVDQDYGMACKNCYKP